MKKTLEQLAIEVERNGIEMEDVMKSKRPETQNAGASLERQTLKAKAKRMLKRPQPAQWSDDKQAGYEAAADEFIDFMDKRTGRDNAKAGGLGKKKRG